MRLASSFCYYWPGEDGANALDIIHASHLHELPVVTYDKSWKNQSLHQWVLEAPFLKNSYERVEALLKLDLCPGKWSFLHEASEMGLSEMVRMSLESGANPNELNAKNYTPLELACRSGSPQTLELLLSFGAKGKEGDSTYTAAIVNAMESGKQDLARLLLCKVTATSEVLLAAVHFRVDEDVLDMILRQGVDPNKNLADLSPSIDKFWDEGQYVRPLYYAACAAPYVGNACVRKLLEFGARPDLEGGPRGTATQAAALHGDLETLELFLRNGKSAYPHEELSEALEGHALKGWSSSAKKLLDVVDPNTTSAFHLACYGADVTLVEAMIERGADTNKAVPQTWNLDLKQRYKSGEPGNVLQMTPLQYACERVKSWMWSRSGRLRIIRLLLDNGADINCVSNSGTALMTACLVDRNSYKTVKFLLDAGAKPAISAGGWTSALECAVATGKYWVAELLLSIGSFNKVQLDSALQAAAVTVLGDDGLAYHEHAVQLLLDHGASLRADDGMSKLLSKEELPLPAACFRANKGAVSALLAAGANVNEPDYYGSPLESALHSVCRLGKNHALSRHRKTVEILKLLRDAQAIEPDSDRHIGVVCNGPLCVQADSVDRERYYERPPAKHWISGLRYVCTKCDAPEINLCSSCKQKLDVDGTPHISNHDAVSGMSKSDENSVKELHANHKMTEIQTNDVVVKEDDFSSCPECERESSGYSSYISVDSGCSNSELESLSISS